MPPSRTFTVLHPGITAERVMKEENIRNEWMRHYNPRGQAVRQEEDASNFLLGGGPSDVYVQERHAALRFGNRPHTDIGTRHRAPNVPVADQRAWTPRSEDGSLMDVSPRIVLSAKKKSKLSKESRQKKKKKKKKTTEAEKTTEAADDPAVVSVVSVRRKGGSPRRGMVLKRPSSPTIEVSPAAGNRYRASRRPRTRVSSSTSSVASAATALTKASTVRTGGLGGRDWVREQNRQHYLRGFENTYYMEDDVSNNANATASAWSDSGRAAPHDDDSRRPPAGMSRAEWGQEQARRYFLGADGHVYTRSPESHRLFENEIVDDRINDVQADLQRFVVTHRQLMDEETNPRTGNVIDAGTYMSLSPSSSVQTTAASSVAPLSDVVSLSSSRSRASSTAWETPVSVVNTVSSSSSLSSRSSSRGGRTPASVYSYATPSSVALTSARSSMPSLSEYGDGDDSVVNPSSCASSVYTSVTTPSCLSSPSLASSRTVSSVGPATERSMLRRRLGLGQDQAYGVRPGPGPGVSRSRSVPHHLQATTSSLNKSQKTSLKKKTKSVGQRRVHKNKNNWTYDFKREYERQKHELADRIAYTRRARR